MFKRKPGRERKEGEADEKTATHDAEVPAGGKARRKRADEGNKTDSGGGWMNMASADPNKVIAEPTIDFEEPATAGQNKDKHFQENNDEILVVFMEYHH